eukprot:7899218-Pyramimonas_sp.AAC.1
MAVLMPPNCSVKLALMESIFSSSSLMPRSIASAAEPAMARGRVGEKRRERSARARHPNCPLK